jgi:outer membrane protein TolC
MPVISIPSLQQAESRIRLYEGTLKVYRDELDRLDYLYNSGQIAKHELEECLVDVMADIANIENELQAAQIIHRASAAA